MTFAFISQVKPKTDSFTNLNLEALSILSVSHYTKYVL